ncbi:uncharacterized protein TRAVEDRAFT_21557 [Trametes versicolor FP-101664 SS1]|uniref:uncharacterized protein n=1 Tax=Trametes versicolor (strain FP-101664) TaxID=717944 RepID=UPI0004621C9B|nr:uncharacterized protein TRAVEDRAFT_21557 [Trametes versicolor FP-101664 SS1]EIW56352.1 hypothetical protein TRAVEDRAFT_21557 [Trametes versicolor FP-101664 SS1]
MCVEFNDPMPIYIAVHDTTREIHWRIVWAIAGPLRDPNRRHGERLEGYHVMEIFVPNEDNATGQYAFRRHFRQRDYGSAQHWAFMHVGTLDRPSRRTLVDYCSEQDPTHVGNNAGSNCITCVVNTIRAMCITPDQINARGPDGQQAEQAIRDAYNYRTTRRRN